MTSKLYQVSINISIKSFILVIHKIGMIKANINNFGFNDNKMVY